MSSLSQRSSRRPKLKVAAGVGIALLITLAMASPTAAQNGIFSSGFESGNILEWDPPTVFRFSDLDLRDPHVIADLGVLGCNDITDDGGLFPSVNELIQDGITMDSEPDGFLDLNVLVQFRPFDPAGMGQRVDQRYGLCTAPMAGTSCTHDPDVDSTIFWYDTLPLGGGTCLEPLPGSTTGYSPQISTPMAPCFVTLEGDLSVGFLGVAFPLQRAQLAATLVGGPPLELSDGLMMGFLSEADADTLTFPIDVPFVGGDPLSSVLPGGATNCDPGDDTDFLDAVRGWWFYFNFVAAEVSYEGY